MSAQKGRDAVRPPQTHLETRSAAITRPKRRPRRIPPRRHRPKPPQARHADPNANADLSNLRRRAAHEHGRDRRSPPPQYFKTDFFNGIAPFPSFPAPPAGSTGYARELEPAPIAHRVHRQETAPDPGVSWPDERKNRSGQALPGRPFFARPSIIRVRLLAYQGCLSFSHFLAESFDIEFRGLHVREQLAF